MTCDFSPSLISSPIISPCSFQSSPWLSLQTPSRTYFHIKCFVYTVFSTCNSLSLDILMAHFLTLFWSLFKHHFIKGDEQEKCYSSAQLHSFSLSCFIFLIELTSTIHIIFVQSPAQSY